MNSYFRFVFPLSPKILSSVIFKVTPIMTSTCFCHSDSFHSDFFGKLPLFSQEDSLAADGIWSGVSATLSISLLFSSHNFSKSTELIWFNWLCVLCIIELQYTNHSKFIISSIYRVSYQFAYTVCFIPIGTICRYHTLIGPIIQDGSHCSASSVLQWHYIQHMQACWPEQW